MNELTPWTSASRDRDAEKLMRLFIICTQGISNDSRRKNEVGFSKAFAVWRRMPASKRTLIIGEAVCARLVWYRDHLWLLNRRLREDHLGRIVRNFRARVFSTMANRGSRQQRQRRGFRWGNPRDSYTWSRSASAPPVFIRWVRGGLPQ